MFAVVKTGGKQYKVAKDDVVRIEKIEGEVGKTVELDQVIMVSDNGKTVVGKPMVAGAKVKAEVLGQDRNDKIIVFKKKRRQNYRRKKGHRQQVTVLRIKDIVKGK